MKRLSVINEVLFAALVAIGCYGITWIVGPSYWSPGYWGPGIWGYQLMRLLIACAAAAQCLHYRGYAERRGNLLLLGLAIGAVVAPGFLLPWTVYFIWAAGVVWCYRSLIRYRSFVPAAADGMLTVCSCVAAIVLAGFTGSPTLAIWGYLLGQALLPVIPTTEGPAGRKGSSDRFSSAHGDAERALRALAVAGR